MQEKNGENKRNVGKRIVAVAIGLGVAAISFFGGYFTRQGMLDDGMQVLLDIKEGIQDSYYQDVTDEEFYQSAIKGVNEFLLDKYSQYMTKEEWNEATAHGQGKYEGVGLAFSSTVDGSEGLRIIRVAGNSPAENAGMQAGSYVVGYSASADGEMQEIASYSALIEILATFEKEQTFYLFTKVSLQDVQVQRYKVEKCAYTESYVYYRNNATAYRFTGDNYASYAFGEPLSVLPNDMAYIKLVQFSGNADKEFDSAMQMFKGENKKNLVLDLRGNGGGYMYIMQSIAKYFCKTATATRPVAAYAQYADKTVAYNAKGNVYNKYFDADSKIYVLADSSTASASECLLGVLLDYGATTYANICLSMRNGVAKTYGKGIMQVTYTLSLLRGDALKLTTARVLWPSQNCIQDRGIWNTDGTKTVEEKQIGDTEIIQALQQFGL